MTIIESKSTNITDIPSHVSRLTLLGASEDSIQLTKNLKLCLRSALLDALIVPLFLVGSGLCPGGDDSQCTKVSVFQKQLSLLLHFPPPA